MTMNKRRIFVFGSNLAGAHGGGAAKFAIDRYGAIWGRGRGLQGNSYAIPTMGRDYTTLPVGDIKCYIAEFLRFAEHHMDDMEFDITPVGCGIAGLSRDLVRPMFASMTPNCHFTTSWDDDTTTITEDEFVPDVPLGDTVGVILNMFDELVFQSSAVADHASLWSRSSAVHEEMRNLCLALGSDPERYLKR